MQVKKITTGFVIQTFDKGMRRFTAQEFVAGEQTDVEDENVRRIPLDWRLRTRDTFLTLFREGYRVTDFGRAATGSPSNYYVLQK